MVSTDASHGDLERGPKIKVRARKEKNAREGGSALTPILALAAVLAASGAAFVGVKEVQNRTAETAASDTGRAEAPTRRRLSSYPDGTIVRRLDGHRYEYRNGELFRLPDTQESQDRFESYMQRGGNPE